MLQIESCAFETVRPLFAALGETQPMCAAVLAGVYPGRVYVDNPANPRAALLLTSIESEANGVWAFLVGKPTNEAFNQELNAAIFSHHLFGEHVPIMFWTCDPGDWGGQLAAAFHPLPPIWMPRHHFVARQARFDWRAALPAGFAIERMDAALQGRPGLALPSDVLATLSKWQKMEQDGFAGRGFRDFGFVTLDVSRDNPVISSWATVDFIVDGKGDLGFFTQPEYRRRGLGKAAAAAALEYGFQHGLQQVNWTCDVGNPGSTRTALALGLDRIDDYQMGLLLFDEKQHMQVLQQYS